MLSPTEKEGRGWDCAYQIMNHLPLHLAAPWHCLHLACPFKFLLSLSPPTLSLLSLFCGLGWVVLLVALCLCARYTLPLAHTPTSFSTILIQKEKRPNQKGRQLTPKPVNSLPLHLLSLSTTLYKHLFALAFVTVFWDTHCGGMHMPVCNFSSSLLSLFLPATTACTHMP